MQSTDSITASTDRATLNGELIQLVDDCASVLATACISTFIDRVSGQIQVIPYSSSKNVSKAMEEIMTSEQPKPVTELMRTTSPMEIQKGSFQKYFTQNADNELIWQERIFLEEEEGYSVAASHYFAIPFPTGTDAQGVFFLFARNEDEFNTLDAHLPEITDNIKKYFDK